MNWCTWQELCYIDADLTSRFVDVEDKRSHKILVTSQRISKKNRKKLTELLELDYEQASRAVTIRPLERNFTKDVGFSSFGVFAKTFLEYKQTVTGLVGRLAYLPESDIVLGWNDVSIFQSAKGPMMMLSTASFVNHSCKPNCIYVPSVKKGFLTIRVTDVRGIQAEQELTVDYGGKYFDNRVNCECPYAEFHGKTDVLDGWTRSGRERPLPMPKLSASFSVTPMEEVGSVVKSRVAVEQASLIAASRTDGVRSSESIHGRSQSQSPVQKQKQHKYVGKRRVRSRRTVHRVVHPKRHYFRRRFPESSSDSVSSSDDCQPFQVFTEHHADLPTYADMDLGQPVGASTPMEHRLSAISDFIEHDGVPDSLTDDTESTPTSDTSSVVESDTKIFAGSRMSVTDYLTSLSEIASEHAISDRALRSLTLFYSECAPQTNNIPSFYAVKKFQHTPFLSVEQEKLNNGIVFHLPIEKQLMKILGRNIDILSSNESWLPENEMALAPESGFHKTLFFVMNTDGVSPSKSKQYQLFPVLIMIANLPPRARQSYRNLILASLFGGSGKPDWYKLFENVKAFQKLWRSPRIVSLRGQSYHVS